MGRRILAIMAFALTALLFGFKETPQFTVEDEKEISKPPKVDFGKPAPARRVAGSYNTQRKGRKGKKARTKV